MISRTRIAGARSLRSLISKRFESNTTGPAPGVWTDFSTRSPSLKLINPDIKKNLLNKIDPSEGPASIQNYSRKLAYHSVNDIDETFKLAYEYLQEESGLKYEQVKALEQEAAASKDPQNVKELKDKIDALLVEAESTNPEVLYNSSYFSSDVLDKSQPVYRQILKEKWESFDLMVTMQRLEQLHVIPDTLPTLVPKVDVKVKFPHNLSEEFSSWVTPGDILPAFAVSQPPTILVQEFERVDSEQLYTVVVVNPDTPDLATNSFSTTLHYGLANVPLNNVDNTISTSKLLADGESFTFKDYLPLTPEKNAQNQRACLWVFRQSSPLEIKSLAGSAENFDIRAFVEQNSLDPVGAHVWRQHYDRSVNDVRKAYGLEKGRVYHRVRQASPVI